MQYITHTRCRIKSISGDVNLPATTPIEKRGNSLYYNGKPLCAATSQNAKDYFCRDDDGHGMERGKLTKSIMKALGKRESRDDPKYRERWNRVWADETCQPFKRKEHADHWLWNDDFFNADIETLEYIARLVGARKG